MLRSTYTDADWKAFVPIYRQEIILPKQEKDKLHEKLLLNQSVLDEYSDIVAEIISELVTVTNFLKFDPTSNREDIEEARTIKYWEDNRLLHIGKMATQTEQALISELQSFIHRNGSLVRPFFR